MQHTSNPAFSQSFSDETECGQEIDFELSETDLEGVVAGNPILAFNKYFAYRAECLNGQAVSNSLSLQPSI
ncbi:MAG: hypothetical protein AAF152_14840 [Cyanobacteria bacterium P01_A01_bin.114]